MISFGIRLRGEIGYNKFWRSFASLNKGAQQYSLLFPEKSYAADESARDLFRKFIKTDDTHLLLLDDDATLAPDTLIRLMSRSLPVVQALVFTTSFPPSPTIWRGATGITPDGKYITWRTRLDDVVRWVQRPDVNEEIVRLHNANPTSGAMVLPDLEGALSRVDNIGFHCTLIRRDVVEAVGEPYCEGNEQGVHEDFDFSRRVSEAGYDMHTDKSVVSGHIAAHDVGFMEFAVWLEAMHNDISKLNQQEDKHDGKG